MAFMKYLLCGLVIGVANIIPGVSGGTFAVILNIYDRLIGAISGFRKQWKKSLALLIPVLLGAGIGILLFANLIGFCLERFPMATNFFFIGLIAGSVPLIFRKATEQKWKPISLIPLAIAFALMACIALFAPSSDTSAVMRELTVPGFFLLILYSAIAAAGMIIPGISGSMLMMIFGCYMTVLTAIKELNILLLIPVAIGVLIGILGGAKLINLTLQKFPQMTYFAILGLILGSLIMLFQNSGIVWNLQAVFAVLLLLAGAAIALVFGSEKFQNLFRPKKPTGATAASIHEPAE